MKNRNPIISGILSILFMGSGQLYNGQLKKAVIFALTIIPLYFFIGFSGLLKSFSGFIISMSLVIAFIVFVLYDAIRWAIKQKNYQLKPVNSLKYYFGFIIGWYIIIFTLPQMVRSITGYEAFEIPTPSMEPSIIVGDRIMATRINPDNIKVGNIITFTKDDGQKYLSRAIGFPGDTIEIIDDKVSINGQSEQWKELELIKDKEIEYQKYASRLPNGKEIGTLKMLRYNGREFPTQEISNQERIVIPENQIFVLGDNRNNSMDSRMYGTVPFKNIDKQVHYVWWSNDKSRIGTKLSE
jgi:signal peptidase I